MYVHVFLISALGGGEGSASHYDCCITGEGAPGAHVGWVGPRAGLDAVTKRKNPCPCRESNPVHPARS